MRVHLAAVQYQLRAEDYYSATSFTQRTIALAKTAVAGVPDDIPRVVAFPEAYAMPLTFWLETASAVRNAPSALAAGMRLLLGRPLELLRHPHPALLYRLRMPTIWPVYQQAFSEAARASGSYLIAGSLFGPVMDDEPAKGLHPPSPAPRNWLAVFSPRGRILTRLSKIHLTAGERSAMLKPGVFGPHLLRTRLGVLGVLICLDAFYEGLIERLDAGGAWLVVQPSANSARWDGPWSADPTRVEGEVWMRKGLTDKLRERENLIYGVNPMLNGDFYQLHFEGRSSIVTAGRVLAQAASAKGDAAVSAQVELPAAATGFNL